MKRALKWIIVVVVLAALAGGGYLAYTKYFAPEQVTFRTAPVERGELLATIAATGIVEPEEVVDVGAQVAGEIKQFGLDSDGKQVDYRSVVKTGTVLAKIDDSLYSADVASAQAQLDLAKAGVVRAKADLEQMKAKLYQAQRDWDRAQKLGTGEALAQSSFDAYQSAFETAKSNVGVDEAAIVQAEATVKQAEAALQRAQRNLSYCTITSPVDGVIIDRRVNIGQTVVSSLNAPSLFLIAKDLKRIEVWVSVNEADVSNIHNGQPVTFTVDTYPGETFKGEVSKVRLNATITQNVVTYTIEVTTDNSSGKLFPYMTAKVQFELSRHEDVLKVPNAALRWSPSSPSMVVADARDALASGGSGRRGGSGNTGGNGHSSGGPGGADRSASSATSAAAASDSSAAADTGPGKFTKGTLWVVDGEFVRPLKIRVGSTDGTMTEVQGKDLKEGLAVVLDVERASAGGTQGAVNPFMPQFPGRGGRPSSSAAATAR